MAKAVLMPQAGISVESCIITEWLKQPGDTVAVGEILFSYETDKASFECESTEAGTLLEQFYGNGDEVPVLVPVCAVGAAGEDVSALRPGGASDPGAGAGAAPAAPEAAADAAAPTAFTDAVASAPPAAPPPAASTDAVASAPPAAPPPTASTDAAASAPPAAPPPAASDAPAGELHASPRARNLAAQHGVDLRLAGATGPYGRVIERDVRALMAGGASATPAASTAVAGAAPGAFAGTGIGGRVSTADLAAPEATPIYAQPYENGYEDVKFSGIRKAISRSMTESLTAIPQLTHNFSFNASAILGYRKLLKAGGEALGLQGVTLGDMVLYAVSRLLPKYPDLNAHMLDGSSIRRFRHVNLGFACDTERGLMVPVIQHADEKSLAEISAEGKALAKAAQSGALSPDLMQGGTFTVSNLGAFGVESFTPVINPPQTGILGVDTIVQRPCEQDGQVKLYPAMGLSLTYDHRAIDGAPASRFVQELCGLLENFTLLLAL